jgi:hypothetical protein
MTGRTGQQHSGARGRDVGGKRVWIFEHLRPDLNRPRTAAGHGTYPTWSMPPGIDRSDRAAARANHRDLY